MRPTKSMVRRPWPRRGWVADRFRSISIRRHPQDRVAPLTSDFPSTTGSPPQVQLHRHMGRCGTFSVLPCLAITVRRPKTRPTRSIAGRPTAEYRARWPRRGEPPGAVRTLAVDATILADKPGVRADLLELELHASDRIQLCSDGLYGCVARDQIERLPIASGDPHQAAGSLLEAAMTSGTVSDNVSVVVLDARLL